MDGPTQPFFYEIRVKGRLSEEQWTNWFDNLVVFFRKGESTLRGQVPDHAALYGLLARLRDLTIPLQTVQVLDAEVRLKLNEQARRLDRWYNLLLITIYLALLGAMVAFSVYLTELINTSQVLALLFASLGALAFAFSRLSGKIAWNWLAALMSIGFVIPFAIFLITENLLPAPVGIAFILLLLAGGLAYLLLHVRNQVDMVNRAQMDWQQVRENGSIALEYNQDQCDTSDSTDTVGTNDAPDRFQPPELESPDQPYPNR
jgi:hypothetical protein